MRASARELPVPFFTPLVWRGRGSNLRPPDPEADALPLELLFNVFYVPASFESFQEAVKNKSCLVTVSFLKNLVQVNIRWTTVGIP